MLRFSCVPVVVSFSILLDCTLILLTASAYARDKIVWSDQEKPIVEQISRPAQARRQRARPNDQGSRAADSAAAGCPQQADASAGALARFLDRRRLRPRHAAGSHHHARDGSARAPSARRNPATRMITLRELASLVRYEHMQATSDNPQFAEAMAQLEGR